PDCKLHSSDLSSPYHTIPYLYHPIQPTTFKPRTKHQQRHDHPDPTMSPILTPIQMVHGLCHPASPGCQCMDVLDVWERDENGRRNFLGHMVAERDERGQIVPPSVPDNWEVFTGEPSRYELHMQAQWAQEREQQQQQAAMAAMVQSGGYNSGVHQAFVPTVAQPGGFNRDFILLDGPAAEQQGGHDMIARPSDAPSEGLLAQNPNTLFDGHQEALELAGVDVLIDSSDPILGDVQLWADLFGHSPPENLACFDYALETLNNSWEEIGGRT
ncbi:hypothetical protein P153DRAFT_405753, partial [Dothidotthia symphoricarpi CBS 119687]